jgi:hypothetical protein
LRRQFNRSALRANHQRLADKRLKFLDLQRYRRLRAPNPVGGFGEARLFGDEDQRAEEIKIKNGTESHEMSSPNDRH